MVRKAISLEEHEAIALQLLEMQQGLDKLVYALFLSYPLDAPANRAVRKMGDACRELRHALQTEAERLDAQTRLYLPAKEEHNKEHKVEEEREEKLEEREEKLEEREEENL